MPHLRKVMYDIIYLLIMLISLLSLVRIEYRNPIQQQLSALKKYFYKPMC